MSILADRIAFAWQFGLLIEYARTLGFDIIIDEVKRGAQQAEWNATHCAVWVDGERCEAVEGAHGEGLGKIAGHGFRPIGIKRSRHLNGLAVDLYIIIDGAISNDALLYQRLGDHWESLDPRNRWLGRVSDDLGHFERRAA